MILLDEALRADALAQLRAVEAAAFPWLEERVQAQIVHHLRWQLLTPEERARQVEANWALLRAERGLH